MQDTRVQSGRQVCVVDRARRHILQHLLVLLHLLRLELLNGQLSVVDCDEGHKFTVLLNVNVSTLDLGLEADHVLLLAALGLKE